MGQPRNTLRLGKLRAQLEDAGQTAYGKGQAPQGTRQTITRALIGRTLSLGRLDLGPDAPVQLMTAIAQMDSQGSSAFASASFQVAWAAGGGEFLVDVDGMRGLALRVPATWCEVRAVIAADIAVASNFKVSGAVVLGALGAALPALRTLTQGLAAAGSASLTIPNFAQRVVVNRTPIAADLTLTFTDNTGGTVGVETLAAGAASGEITIPGGAIGVTVSSVLGGTFNLVFMLGL